MTRPVVGVYGAPCYCGQCAGCLDRGARILAGMHAGGRHALPIALALWQDWAYALGHAEGCQCRGCVLWRKKARIVARSARATAAA